MSRLLVLLWVVVSSSSFARERVVERFGDHAIVRLFADNFEALPKNERIAAWHLTLASFAGESITYDQFGWRNLEVKRLLETVYLFGREGTEDSAFDPALASYLKKFYGHIGNHDTTTARKFVPEFVSAQLQDAAVRAKNAGAPQFAGMEEDAVRAAVISLEPAIFDPEVDPMLVSKAPPPGKDLLTGSANTFYGPEVTLSDLEGFKEKNPLNSRLVKKDGKLVEQVYRVGGLYGEQLTRVNAHLREAGKAAPGLKPVLDKLIRYFETGDLKDWDAYNIAWLKNDGRVDAQIGFIESYIDARGVKATWEGIVNYADAKENRIMAFIGKRAQYFEDRMPWPEKYRRKKITLPVAKAINVVAAYPQPPGGINLPNEQAIREKYGSKSVLIANTTEAGVAVKRLPLSLLFAAAPEDAEQAKKYAARARKLLVAFHEVTGHASGRVDPALKGNPQGALKEYGNTLEEARADLVALWHAFDPALKEWDPEHDAIARELYRGYLVNGLTNLSRAEHGDELEEDHLRGTQMIVRYIVEKGGARLGGEAGKRAYQVTDFAKMRAAVGELLSRLMVIKATGDYAGIKALVQQYGVKFDPALRDEVVARVKAADLPLIVIMVTPRLSPVVDAKGKVTDVKISFDQQFIDQHLERSVLGRLPPAQASKAAAGLRTPEDIHAAMKRL